jgi:hypothetical protein
MSSLLKVKEAIINKFFAHVNSYKTDIEHDLKAINEIGEQTKFIYCLRDTGSHLIALKNGSMGQEHKRLVEKIINWNTGHYLWDGSSLSPVSRDEAIKYCEKNDLLKFFG